MQDLDKCKRRVIRTVARRLLNEKQPEDVVWEALAKDTGCDCRSLWSRLRGLTIKKLDRLLAADDCRDKIAPVAQMTITDWLLCDLVLVHENVDLIGRSKSKIMKNSKALCELFSLVQRYDIEGETEPTKIARKWASAAAYYNKGGIQCSPMLLQRRWHQLKEATRDSFYKLWNSYKGNHKVYEAILKEIHPSILQMAVAKRYHKIITQPLLKWDEMLQKRLVVLPEELELYSGDHKENPQSEEDLVLVEPVIETIDLGVEDDKGNVTDNTSTILDVDETSISADINEPSTSNDSNIQIDGLSNVRILAATHIPIENLDNDNGDSSDEDYPVEISNEDSDAVVESGKEKDTIPERLITIEDDCNVEDKNTTEDLDNIDNDNQQNSVSNEVNELLQGKLDLFKQNVKDKTLKQTIKSQDTVPNPKAISDNVKVGKVSLESDKIQHKSVDKETNKSATSVKKVPEIVLLSDDDIIESDVIHSKEIPVTELNSNIEKDLDDIIKHKAHKYIHRKDKNEENVLKYDVDGDKLSTNNSLDDIIKDKAEEFVQKISQRVISTDEDDDEDYLQCDLIQNRSVEDIIQEKSNESVHNIEKKPVLNTLNFGGNLDFAANGVEIVDDGIDYVDDEIDYVDDETPQNNMSEPESLEAQAPKFDEKLLMLPIVYTTKLDDMAAFKGLLFSEVRHSRVIDDILTESKPVKKVGPKLKTKDSKLEINIEKSIEETVSDSESEISDDCKVKTTSYLLRKPRTRNYNPIQLCKNPDFNTRLKRLTVGFLSSTRNRAFLKQLKPMTIDLHKAFESKLINGTLYLKRGGNISEPEISKEYHQAKSSDVMPSAMPIQCLIDNVITDAVPKLASRSNDEVAQRNKVIHLPDITEIRRINQKLLTAKVSPIRIDNTLYSEPNANVQPVLESNSSSNVNTVASSKNVTDPDTNEGINLYANQHVPNSDNNSIPVETNVNKNSDTSTVQKSVPSKREIVRSYVPKPASKRAPVLPWNVPKSKQPEPEEFLLTPDTLNKMLVHIHAILDTSEITSKTFKIMTGQCKPKEVVQQKPKQVEKNTDVSSTKLKDKSISMKDKTLHKKKQRKSKNPQFCCFAAYKKSREGKRLNKMHGCPPSNCQCCCLYMLGEKKGYVPPLITPAQQKVNIDQTLKNACASIELVDQQSNEPDPLPSVHIEQECLNVPIKTKIVTRKWPTQPYMPKLNTETSKETSEIIDLDSPIYANDKPVLEIVPKLVHIGKLGLTSNKNIRARNFQPSEAGPSEQNFDSDQTSENAVHIEQEHNANTAQGMRKIVIHIPKTRNALTNFPCMSKSNIEMSHNTSEIIDLESPLITNDKNALENVPILVPTPDLTRNVSDSQNIRVRNIEHLKAPKRFLVNKVTSGTNTESDSALQVVDDDVAIVLDPANSNTQNNIVQSPRKPRVSQTENKLPKLAPSKVNNFITIDGSQGINRALGELEINKHVDITKKRKVTHVSLTVPKNNNPLPLFIGEHQILLTTATIPGKTERKLERSPQKSVLPNGVNLAILPDGEIKYTVDSGSVLNMEDLDGLPAIIRALKEQLATQTLGVVTASENDSTVLTNIDNPKEVISAHPDGANNSEAPPNITDISTDSEEIIKDPANQTHMSGEINAYKDNSQNTLTKPRENEEQLEKSDLEICNVENHSSEANSLEVQQNIISSDSEETFEDPASQTHLSDKKNMNNDFNVIKTTSSNSTYFDSAEDLVPSSQEKDIIRTEDVAGSSAGSRNLLSDLMEMSGISAEDAAPLPEPVPNKSLPALPLIYEATMKPDSGQTLKSVKLTSISSLEELKCACSQNAEFYKLNCSTGLIVRIDVCLKKSKKPSAAVLPRSVQTTIDLTDENEDQQPVSISPASNEPVSKKPVSISTASIQPATNQRVYKPGVSKQPIHNQRVSILPVSTHNKSLLKPLAVPNNPAVRGVIRRVIKLADGKNGTLTIKPLPQFTKNPRTLLKVGNKLVIKPTNTPSTECIDGEVVPENKETADSTLTEAAIRDVPCDYDDSSDDEPLAKKIKRRDEAASTSDDTHDIETNKETHDMETQDTEPNVPANTNNVEGPIDDEEFNTNDEVSDKDEGEEMDIDDTMSSFTFFDEGADSGEDCILGV